MRAKEQFEWCVAKLEPDFHWWIDETSEAAADGDGLVSVFDPKQVEFMLDLLDPLRKYGLQMGILEKAFLPLAIDKDLGNKRLRLVPSTESLASSDEKLFALPHLSDESYGGYAEFIDHISALRVKLLNDCCNFKQNLTIDELEEELRNLVESTGENDSPGHLFQEVLAILEYCPAGYEDVLEGEDDPTEEDWLWNEESAEALPKNSF